MTASEWVKWRSSDETFHSAIELMARYRVGHFIILSSGQTWTVEAWYAVKLTLHFKPPVKQFYGRLVVKKIIHLCLHIRENSKMNGLKAFSKEINFKHSLKAQFNRAQINNSKKSIYPANSDWILEAPFENCLEKHLLYLLTYYECFPIFLSF